MKKQVLLVDDEPLVLESLKRLLKASGIPVLTAENGEQALKCMACQPSTVVISDYRMPGLKGTELLARIEARWPETTRFLLSGYADYDAVTEAIQSGVVHSFLAKPWKNDELVAQLKFVLNHASDNKSTSPISNSPSSINPIKIGHSAPDSQLRVMLDTIADGILRLDRDGVILSANPAVSRIYGYQTDLLIGQHMRCLFPNYTKDSATETGEQIEVDRLFANRSGIQKRVTGVRQNGAVFPLEMSLCALPSEDDEQLLMIVRDTSRRMRAERQNQLLLSSLDICLDGFALFSAGDRLLHCNKQFRTLYGACAEGLEEGLTYEAFFEGCIASGLFPDGKDPAWLDSLLSAHATMPMVKEVKLTGDRWIQIHENRADNGAVIAFHIDITHLKHTEQAMQQAVAEAQEASDAKGRFLAMMSHEIRTPLNGVLGLLQLLGEEPLSETQQNYVETALMSGRSLLTIISDILDFSKLEAGKMEIHETTGDLRTLGSEVKQILMPRVEEKSINLHVVVADDVPLRVRVDSQRLRQVLLNLVGNAIKFTDYGEVDLSITRTQNGEILFDVRDTGIGIPEDQQHKVFSEFSSGFSRESGRVHEGTGLGLAISRHLIDLMGGALAFSSVHQEGSHFWFALPLAAVSEPDQSQDVVLSDTSFTGCVLLVDDSATNRLVAKAMLESVGIEVSVAEDGYAALTICSTERFDAVLMDISMPGIDGMETTSKLLELTDWNGAPVIALTAYAMPGDRERFLTAGMCDYLEKPIDKLSLLQVVGKYLKVGQPERPDMSVDHKPEVGVLDVKKLDALAKDTSEEILPQLVKVFLEDSGDRLEQLQKASQAFDHTDKTELERHLHTLGSSAALYGLMPMSELARTLERSCQEHAYEHVSAELERFIAMAKASGDALQQHIDMRCMA